MNFTITDTAERWAAFWKDVTLVMPEIWLVIAMCAVILTMDRIGQPLHRADPGRPVPRGPIVRAPYQRRSG